MNLDDIAQKILRTKGILREDEVALKEGDLLIALNVVTQQRRIIPTTSAQIEEIVRGINNKQLLKG
tara:strand:+ start:237 stop:434 length:198 start_codon:yes stop_codon:yes gene_type:complete